MSCSKAWDDWCAGREQLETLRRQFETLVNVNVHLVRRFYEINNEQRRDFELQLSVERSKNEVRPPSICTKSGLT